MTLIDEGKVRVAKAEDDLAKLVLKIENDKSYGSLSALDKACKDEKNPTKRDRAKAFKTKYNEAKKEVRLAKSALERLRNEDKPKVKLTVPAPSNAFEGKLIDVSRAQGFEVEVKDRPAYMKAMDDNAKAVECTKAFQEGRMEMAEELAKERLVTAPKQLTTKLVDELYEEALAGGEASRMIGDMNIHISAEGISINGAAPLPVDAVRAAIKAVKRQKQLGLDMKPLPELTFVTEEDTEFDEKEYKRIRSGGLVFRVSKEWYDEKLIVKKRGESEQDHRQRMLKAVQVKCKHRDPYKPLPLGERDQAELKIYQKVLRGAGYE